MAEQNTITIQFGAKGDKDVIDAINKLDRSTKKLIDTQAKITNFNKKNTISTKKQSDGMKKLFIQLRSNNQSFKDLGLSTSILTKAFKGNRIALAQVRNAMKKLNLENEKADVTTRILGGTVAVLRSKLLLAGFAMTTLVRPVMRLVSEGANIESVKIAFDTLTGATENSEVALEKLQQATNNTMSEFDLFKQANNAMILGVTKNSDEMAEMFDIAQRLGRALGRDTASSVESLVTGIGRQSRLMLDNIGIIVKSEEAYENYAKANDLLVSSLTDAQKKQAFLEATMESARKKIKDVGEEIPTARDSLDAFTASVSNLGTTIGQNIPFTDTLLKFFTNIANKANDTIKGEERIVQLNDSLLAQTKQRDRLLSAIQSKFFTGSAEKELKVVEDRIKSITEEISALMEKEIADKKALEIAKQKKEAEQKALRIAKRKIEAEKKASEQKKQQLKEEQDIINSIAEANKIVHKNNLEFQFLQIELQAKRFEQLKLENEQLINQADIVKFVEDAKFEAVSNNLQKTSALYNSFEAGYDTFINSLTDMEMTGAERRKQIFESTKNAFVGFLGEMLKEKIKQIIVEQVISKTAKATSIVEAQATGALIAQAYAVPAFLASTASFGSASVAGLTSLRAGVAGTKALATFEEGGLIGGRRHSQGGTIIEAERGEFIMSRNAVQSIGVETLNQMNQNGVTGSTVNVTIQGGVVDDSYVNNTLIPALNKATSLGNKINA